jgi:hypothetical protein
MRTDHQRDVRVSVGLFVLTALSRVPFRSRILYHWDSVNFAYAIREFSVAKEQPHPPGYIVYVYLCRLVDVIFGDAQTTMVAISIVASALAVVALYWLGRSTFNRRVGLLAALFLATSPLFWFYGEIALPHTLDTLLVITGAWWLYETMKGRDHFLYPAVALVAFAGGVRQQTIVFLAPVLLFALRRVGWRRFLAAGALGAVICLAWFVPLVALNGGFSNYMEAMGTFGRRFQTTTSVFVGAGWWGVQRNVRKLTMYTLYGWGLALLPAVATVIRRLFRREGPARWDKAIFLLLWIAPAVLFYALAHMGQQGLVFVFLPSLLLISAVGLERLLAARPRWLIATTTVLVALNAGIFGLSPEYPLGAGPVRVLTRATLVNSDSYYEDRFQAIEENFPPASTAILAADWHHVEYYLPAYTLLPFDVVSKWEKGEGSPRGPRREVTAGPAEFGLQPDEGGQVVVVVFDPYLITFSESPALAQELPLRREGGSLSYFVLSEAQGFHYGTSSFGVTGG